MNKQVYDILYKRADQGKHGIWVNCGVLIEKEDGSKALKLDVIPVGEWNGWLNVQPKRKKS